MARRAEERERERERHTEIPREGGRDAGREVGRDTPMNIHVMPKSKIQIICIHIYTLKTKYRYI